MEWRSAWALVAVLATPGFSESRTAMNDSNFSADEIRALRSYWSAPGRVQVQLLNEDGREFSVRQTVEGSQWLWNYNKARGLAKGDPGSPLSANSQRETVWTNWINARIEWDYAQAAVQAAQRNRQPAPAVRVPNPGPCPADLVNLAGNPPAFAAPARPEQHTLTFPDGMKMTYNTHVPMRKTFAYFRWPQGVQSMGQRVKTLPERELQGLFQKAGLNKTEQNVFAAVSMLEGGFDSVNTYDTGFVSVGLIQFATLKEGGHSLGQVMLRMKQEDPEEFRTHFRKFGLDVTDNGLLMAADLESGATRIGPEANQQIIEDKRLIAAFQRAGRISEAFRVAQLKTAKAMYYPADDVIRVDVNGTTMTGRVGDVFRTEAGLATLMDRKVNTGNLGRMNDLVGQAVREYDLVSVKDAAQLEFLLIQALVFRKNYLLEASLSQPARPDVITSRSGTRRLRGPL